MERSEAEMMESINRAMHERELADIDREIANWKRVQRMIHEAPTVAMRIVLGADIGDAD